MAIMSRDMLRHLPNAISCARLAAVPFLAGAAATGHRDLFKWLLLACFSSDILDGAIARAFDVRSKLGAALDSNADLLVELCALYGLFVFHREVVRDHVAILATAVALYLLEIALSLWRYGRLSSFHTVMSRVAGYGQGLFLLALFFFGWSPWLFHGAVGLAIAASLEELELLRRLPEWRADVGGLWRLRRDRSGPPA
jgi:CDP-diacylglycerol--glycerol-3-phosphate 3-phosphatidyltransferase